ncbi:hypothetical protein B7494_g5350 [Chlorociboria aeruginascens]|nr:hypothetical protein B7494_g5350 [Chlorociboria aeruginascens]
MMAYLMAKEESKETCNELLDLDKDFAAQVAHELLARLCSEDGLEHPSNRAQFDEDDSDSDVQTDIGSDDHDSDEYIRSSVSGDNESDSLFGAASKEGEGIEAPLAEHIRLKPESVEYQSISSPDNGTK